MEQQPSSPESRSPAARILALRRLSAERAADLRTELPARIGGLLAEIPGADMVMTTIVNDDGMIDSTVSVLGDGAGEVAGYVTNLLESIGEIGSVPTDSEQLILSQWPVAPVGSTALGFVADDATSAATWKPTRVVDGTAMATDLARTTAAGVRVELRSTNDPERFKVRITALGAGAVPSVQLRALIRRSYVGLRVATEERSRWMSVKADELAGAVTIPIGTPDPVPGFFTASAAPIPVSPSRLEASEKQIRIGDAVNSIGRSIPISLPATERLRHVQIVGRTGTGKSSTIAGLMYELGRSGEGGLVLDPHGTLVDRILVEMPPHVRKRTWVIRCGDVGNPVPLSPLADADPIRREIAIDATCAIFQELYDKKEAGIVGPRFRERVSMGLRALSALYGETASILDVPVILADDVMMSKAAKLGNARLAAWFANDKLSRRSSDYGELVSWVNSKFEAFASTAAVRAILGSGHNAIDFGETMDEQQIVLVDLSKAELGESAARLLGYLYLNRAWVGALQRKRRDRPFTVVVDEAQSLISGSLSSMLSEGRKFGLSVILAHQYLDQLDEDLRPAVDGNVSTTIAFRSAARDAHALVTRLGGQVDATTLTTLPDLTAVLMRSSAPAAIPHTLVVNHNERVHRGGVEELAVAEADVRERTQADLVDQYRCATLAAAQGVSRVSAGPRVSDAGRSMQTTITERASFLDEWLAKRNQRPDPPKPQGSATNDSTPEEISE